MTTTIETQGGAVLAADGSLTARQALAITISNVAFEGQIHFGYANRLADYAVSYTNDARLLTLKDTTTTSKTNPGGKTWWVTAGASKNDEVNLKDALFNKNVLTGTPVFLNPSDQSADLNWSVSDAP